MLNFEYSDSSLLTTWGDASFTLRCLRLRAIALRRGRLSPPFSKGFYFLLYLNRWLETAVCHKWHVRWCERGRKPPTQVEITSLPCFSYAMYIFQISFLHNTRLYKYLVRLLVLALPPTLNTIHFGKTRKQGIRNNLSFFEIIPR